MSSQFDIAAFGGGALAGNTGYTYDRNGNLKTLERNVNNFALDNLAYTYKATGTGLHR